MEVHLVWQSETQEIAVIGMYINIASEPSTVAPAAPATTAVEKRGRFFRRGAQPLERRQHATAPAGGPTVLLETIFSVVDSIATPGTKVETPPLIMSEVIDLLKANTFQGYVYPSIS